MKGKSQQAVGAPKAKLLANINPVVLYRSVMDEQLGADLFARFIVGDHMQNLPFGSRQVVEPRFILQQSLRTVAAAEKVSNQRRAHVEASRCNRADGFRNLDRRAILEDVTLDSHAAGAAEPKPAPSAAGHDPKRIAELESELNRSRQHLQTIIEAYESSQEEMKAANEEMQSTNEELRSTMEELETSKEELQSINEELQAVNQENRHKVEELSQLSSDLQNLLAATEIATLFLDRDLRILRFTPRLAELFNVRVTDRGRPISDLTRRLGYEQLTHDGESVLVKLIPIEREIRNAAGRWYLTRVMPYRSTDDRIEGIVITFVEITARKLAEAALRDSEEKYRNLFNSIDEGFCIIEVLFNAEDEAYDYRFIELNPAFAKHTCLAATKGRTILEVSPQHEKFWFETYGEIVRNGEARRFEYQAAGLNRWLDVYAFRIGMPEEKKVAVLLTDVGEEARGRKAARE
jgi:two-component system, chemotaxis family, CheB/CheR fusion protein